MVIRSMRFNLLLAGMFVLVLAIAWQQALALTESTKAQLELQRYYLDNTLMVAPEDGHIVNLQVQPGMVAGIYRIGRNRRIHCR